MTGSDSNIFIDPKNQELKKQLVLEELTKFIFTADNDVLSKYNHLKLVKKELLREVATSYSDPDTSRVTIDVISGGLTNYSFKINFPGTCLPLYAKLSFETAFWNPNKDEKFDLQRTKNEYDMMKLFASEMDSMVATPYACLDLYTQEDGPMKLLITEWCHNDQQMAHQFTVGHIDSRLGPKLAHALASLHSIPNFDPNANSRCREYFSKAFELIRHTFDCDLKKSSGRTAKLCQLLDHSDDKILDTIYHNCLQILGQRECLVHNDFHFFNVIVEKCINETSSYSFQTFGPDGSVTIVDWEMCMAGVAGSDVGHGLGFVLACAVAHAFNGRMNLCHNVLNFCFQFWDSYANEIRQNMQTKNVEQVLEKRFCDFLGGIGIMAYCGHYFMGVHMEFLPPTKTDEDESSHQQRNNEYVRDAIGVIGLKVLQMAYGMDASSSLETMQMQYKTLVQEETERAYKMFQQNKQKQSKKENEDTRHKKHVGTGHDIALLKPRSKSFFLHRTTVPTTMNRRVSDTSGLNLVQVLLHTSSPPVIAFENSHRTSVF